MKQSALSAPQLSMGTEALILRQFTKTKKEQGRGSGKEWRSRDIKRGVICHFESVEL